MGRLACSVFDVGGGLFLDCDVVIFDGVEDLAAILTLDKLYVVLAGDNFDNGVFAGRRHRCGERIFAFSLRTEGIVNVVLA
jgi:hypothetical protein